jgi:hypothetical protein
MIDHRFTAGPGHLSRQPTHESKLFGIDGVDSTPVPFLAEWQTVIYDNVYLMNTYTLRFRSTTSKVSSLLLYNRTI